MRALALTTSYPLDGGSLSGRFIEELLQGLAPRGWSFHVLTPASVAGPRRFESGAITVEAVAYPGHRTGLVHAGGIPDRLGAAPWLAAALPGMTHALARAAARRAQREPFDLIWSHWLLPSGWIGAGLARRTGLPHLATAHGGDVHLVERLVRLPGLRALLAGRFRHTRLSAPAAFTAARVRAALGLAPIDVAALPAEAAVERAAGRPHGAPLRLLFLGRFEPIKGAGLLIEAARLIERDRIELVLAGAGREEAALRASARGLTCPVMFTGILGGAERLAAVRSADLLVIPSRRSRSGRTEGLPHAASMALASGVPVLTSDGGALAALVRAHDAGVVFSPGGDDRSAVKALAGAIAGLAADPERLAAIGRGAREAGAAFHAHRALPAWDRLLRATAGLAADSSPARSRVLEPQR